MSFNFGTSTGASNPATTSAAPAGGLFGGSSTPSFSFSKPGAANTPQQSAQLGGGGGGGLFGATPAQKPGGLFGNTPSAGTTSGAAPSLFGTTNAGTTATTGGTGLFGGSTNTAGGTGLFGNNATPAAGSAPAPAAMGGLFGPRPTGSTPNTNTAAPQLGTVTTPSGGSLFGGLGVSTQATPAKPLFSGMGSTTPAGAPPAGDAKPATGGLFGSATQPAMSQATTTPSLFGQSQAGGASMPTGLSATPAASGASSLFGNKLSTGAGPGAGGLFGGQPAAAPSGTGAQVTTASTTPSLFSSPAPALSGKPLFGGAPNPAPAPGTTASTPAAAKPLFGSATPASNVPAASTAAAPGLFASTPATTAATAAPGNLFTKPMSTAATSSSATTPAMASAQAPGGLFGTPKPASSAAPAPATTTTAPAAISAGAVTSAPATTTAAAPSLFGTSTTASSTAQNDKTASTAAALSSSTMGPASQLPRLKNKTMDEIITRWATDLTKYQKEFKEQASKVAEWDRLLVEGGEKLQKLFVSTYEAERASHEIERQLATVESQQDELAGWLDRYEADVNELFGKQMGSNEQITGPDQERERTYKLAEKLTDRLDDMGKDLTKMIKEINDMSSGLSKGSKPDDPLSQIVRVLNGHLVQLQWIDSNAAVLQSKVAAAQKASGSMGTSTNFVESDASESFYRSYRGGR